MFEAAAQDPIERDQYKKIHSLADKVEQLTGVVRVSNEINLQLVGLMKKALLYMFWIIVLLIGTVIYGAIGKEGFYAVRHAHDLVDNKVDNHPYFDERRNGTILVIKKNKEGV